ncbi:helix-turn-helix domain-containing protein [Streptomyces sp. SID8375]|uniref:helix-turn-helix domain-containing protein n=1 Tax=unclassified Streptomyces TaxID=2593676 RepID=UPI000367770A|nr:MULTISPECIES: helix-turn-helix transcriptional regulator [unclassified Streptomyces]MYT14174.1 helix-turn-helix domain-containing protein [Streptomyces sp. SID4951]MYX06284.1 helix-turn-helix domain-containing protein [Streptomyces sp. SID8375]SCK58295.1 Helix-turn-helix domain-containing protein [Streptomyces sp. SceaMP-e96]
MVEKNSEEDAGSARWVLACELSRLRESSGRSLAQLSDEANYDRTYLHRLETGERLSKLPVMETLDRIYGTSGLLVRLWGLARLDAFADRYKLFMKYEAKATIMHKYMLGIPGLLQTEDYARFVLSSAPSPMCPDELEEAVAIRIGRQDLLRASPPPSVRVILDESAFMRPPADTRIWSDQLAHLVSASEMPNITIQVLPFAAGPHDLIGGSLSLLWMADGTAVAYLEGNKSGDLIEDAAEIGQLRLSYDHLRDMALTPPDSVAFIEQLLEDSRP